MNGGYGIRHHAVLYALIVKYVFKYAKKENGERIVKEFTRSYGLKRGKRMRDIALKNDEPLNIDSFFIHGEWAAEKGENISHLSVDGNDTVSTVKKCAWYEYWKVYGLLEYGPYYCRYIDKAICEGFNGVFSLDLVSAIGLGDSQCEFRWNEPYDKDYLSNHPKKWILSFDFHCRELLDTAYETLDEDIRDKLLDDAEREFEEIFR